MPGLVFVCFILFLMEFRKVYYLQVRKGKFKSNLLRLWNYVLDNENQIRKLQGNTIPET
jgi:hypothetical protein